MKKGVRTLALILASLLFFQHSFGWGLTGHRTIGQIAERHLSKKAKKEIRKLFGKESLAWWTNWPDFVRSDSNWDHTSTWHYVDLPGHLPKDSFIAGLKLLPGKTLYTQIPALIAGLKDGSRPVEERRNDLIFLIHLLGDLHQPLHVGRHDDAGGNKITVYWFDRKTNLHTLWDSMLIDFQQYSYTEYANLLDIRSREDVQKYQAGSLDDWFYESHVLSDSIYDASPNEAKLGYKYNYQFQRVLNEQLLKGGIRLATVLNQAFE